MTVAAVAVGYLVGQSARKSEDAVALLVNQRVTDANTRKATPTAIATAPPTASSLPACSW